MLLDGESLVELVELGDTTTGDTSIPYYYFEGDLPPGYWATDDPTIKCIGVCSCGEAGCGAAECRVVREGDVIVFRDFSSCVNPKFPEGHGGEKEFRITSDNYDSVVADIMKQVADYHARA